jgi:hypothetical protein
VRSLPCTSSLALQSNFVAAPLRPAGSEQCSLWNFSGHKCPKLSLSLEINLSWRPSSIIICCGRSLCCCHQIYVKQKQNRGKLHIMPGTEICLSVHFPVLYMLENVAYTFEDKRKSRVAPVWHNAINITASASLLKVDLWFWQGAQEREIERKFFCQHSSFFSSATDIRKRTMTTTHSFSVISAKVRGRCPRRDCFVLVVVCALRDTCNKHCRRVLGKLISSQQNGLLCRMSSHNACDLASLFDIWRISSGRACLTRTSSYGRERERERPTIYGKAAAVAI